MVSKSHAVPGTRCEIVVSISYVYLVCVLRQYALEPANHLYGQ